MAVGFFGKLLLKKVSPTVKSLKPKVGSLKTRRTTQEDVIKSADKAIKKNKLTKEQGVAVKKSIAPGLRKISKTQDRIDKLTRQKKMGGGMMGRRMGYSQGKLAVTPREKQLAAQYGDKKRITRGDVITAAKKKSGEEPMRDRMKQPLKKKGT